MSDEAETPEPKGNKKKLGLIVGGVVLGTSGVNGWVAMAAIAVWVGLFIWLSTVGHKRSAKSWIQELSAHHNLDPVELEKKAISLAPKPARFTRSGPPGGWTR